MHRKNREEKKQPVTLQGNSNWVVEVWEGQMNAWQNGRLKQS